MDYVTKELAKLWTDRMDAVFKRHIGSDIKPYELTNKDDKLAILLGMDLANFDIIPIKDGLGFQATVEAKYPTSIFWNGKTFDVKILKDKQC